MTTRLYHTQIGHQLNNIKGPALRAAQQGGVLPYVETALHYLSSQKGAMAAELQKILDQQWRSQNASLWQTQVNTEIRNQFDQLNTPLQQAAKKLKDIFSGLFDPKKRETQVDILETLEPRRATTTEVSLESMDPNPTDSQVSSFVARTKIPHQNTQEMPIYENASYAPRSLENIKGSLNSFQKLYLYFIFLGYNAWTQNTKKQNSLQTAELFIQKLSKMLSYQREQGTTPSPLKQEIEKTVKQSFDLFCYLVRISPDLVTQIEQIFLEVCLNQPDVFVPENNKPTAFLDTTGHSAHLLNLSSFWAFAQRLRAYVENATVNSPQEVQISAPSRIFHGDRITFHNRREMAVDLAPLLPVVNGIVYSVMTRLDQASTIEIIQELIFKYYAPQETIYSNIFKNKSPEEKTVIIGLILQAAGFAVQVLECTIEKKHNLALEVKIYPHEDPIICIPFYSGEVPVNRQDARTRLNLFLEKTINSPLKSIIVTRTIAESERGSLSDKIFIPPIIPTAKETPLLENIPIVQNGDQITGTIFGGDQKAVESRLSGLPSHTSAVTNLGKGRLNNEDSLGYFSNGKFRLFVIADGMGGAENGEIASRLGITVILDSFQQTNNLTSALAHTIDAFNNTPPKKDAQGQPISCGTTLSAFLIDENGQASFRTIGDTSTLVFDDKGRLVGLSIPQNYRQIMNLMYPNFSYDRDNGDALAYALHMGDIFQDNHKFGQTRNRLLDVEAAQRREATFNKKGEVVIRTLKTTNKAEIDPEELIAFFPESIQLKHNWRVVLASDGLINYLELNKIIALVKQGETSEQITQRLMQAVLEGEAKDNISIITYIHQVGLWKRLWGRG